MAARLRLDLDEHLSLGDLETFLHRAYTAGLPPASLLELVRSEETVFLQTPNVRITRTTVG